VSPPGKILEIVRQSLECGQTVEIEGLGTFRTSAEGRYEFSPQAQPEIFVAYVAEDLVPARRLCEALRAEGFSPWLDRDKLLPGQNWPRAIARAIEISDAFVACFSPRSISKRGQFQSELRWALDCARRLPLDSVFLVPVRLEMCAVPRRISEQVQYVDLFPDWEKGVRRISRSLHRSVERRRALAGNPASYELDIDQV
jgi:hypothetical protein